jgi:serine protease AprX
MYRPVIKPKEFGMSCRSRFEAVLELGVLTVLLSLCLALPSEAMGGAVTNRLDRALVEKPDQMVDEQGRLSVWVYFRDRGLGESALENALAEAESGLSDKTRARRAGSPLAEGSLVDEADLAVNESYVAEVMATGAKPRHRSRLLNACSVQATAEQIAAIASIPFVSRVDLVARYVHAKLQMDNPEQVPAVKAGDKDFDGSNGHRFNYGPSLHGLEQMNIPQLHDQGYLGKGVTIAIFDAGFEWHHECVRNVNILDSYDFVDDDNDVGREGIQHQDVEEHGTQVLAQLGGYHEGNLIGVAPEASYLLARTESVKLENTTEEDNWIAALEWAEDRGVDVVSTSVGYFLWYEFSDMDGSTAPITIAADLAVLRGVTVVASAGNWRQYQEWGHIIAPSDGHYVIAVGGVGQSGQLMYFSSPGPTADGRIKPDVMALADYVFAPHIPLDDVYTYVRSVDFSVPVVAGLAALLTEQSPYLSPLQIRDAIRETSSRAQLPDNDYGWGTINGWAASEYWVPAITHEPQPDKKPRSEPAVITAEVTSRLPLLSGGVSLAWRVDAGDWKHQQMQPTVGNEFQGSIPTQIAGTQVEYYIAATNELGLVTNSPRDVPASYHEYSTHLDTTPPVITHYSLGDATPENWPPLLTARVDDDFEIDRVEVYYTFAGSSQFGPELMTQVGDHFEIPFPSLIVPPPVGVEFTYYLVAWDSADIPNVTISETYSFQVTDVLARVMVVSNRWIDEPAREWVQLLSDEGYHVDFMPDDQLTNSSLLGYDIVFYTAGNRLPAVPRTATRTALLNWVESGGRLLIEGGGIADDVTYFPEMKEFATKVLHIDTWIGNGGFEMIRTHTAKDHPFFHRPNVLGERLTIIPSPGIIDFGKGDLVYPTDDARLLYYSSFGSTLGGVIAYDDNTGIDSGQTIYLAFDLAQISTDESSPLLTNTLAYLSKKEAPGPSLLTGRVTLAGGTSPAGIPIQCGRDHSTVTGADGTFTVEGLWGGDYAVTAQTPGYSLQTRQVSLLEGETVSGVEFYLMPVTPVFALALPNLEIPDNDPVGIISSVSVASAGYLSGIEIEADIRHFSIGQLQVTLTSPSGTVVALNQPSDNINDHLIGTWPTTLHVDGPGTLKDFRGEPIQGAWRLHVSDNGFGAAGTLKSWGLNLLATVDGASAVDDNTPAVTRLVGNSPNPFNPRTTISFELAQAGKARLNVFDTRGRLVRRLVDQGMAAGPHSVIWDGLDSSGRAAASGTYFYRLEAPELAQVGKMLLLR